MKTVNVVAAVICDSLREKKSIFATARGYGEFKGQWEFPGGKIEPGEAKHTAIERELREEMDVHVSVKESDLYMTVHHDYPDFSMTMYAFYCHLDKPDFVRKEHVDAKWMAPEDMPTLNWAPADVPIMKKLAGK